MGELGANSKIEWTDHTFNPWRGCQHAVLGDGTEHSGCAHCYAEAMSGRNPKALGEWGADGKRVKASEAMWREPLKWNREAEAAGVRARVFAASLADVFEDWTGPIHDHKGHEMAVSDGDQNLRMLDGSIRKGRPGTMDDLRRDLFELIDATPWLDWLLVTKRPGNVPRMWTLPANGREPGDTLYLRRENVWLLTSISNQPTCDELEPQLRACRDLVPVLGLSAEPLLGPIRIQPITQIDWVIAGGESGHHARPMHPDWVRSLRDQCQAAGAAFFFKQWGEWHSGDGIDSGTRQKSKHGFVCRAGHYSELVTTTALEEHAKNCTASTLGGPVTPLAMYKVGKHTAGRLLDSREWNEFPQMEKCHA